MSKIKFTRLSSSKRHAENANKYLSCIKNTSTYTKFYGCETAEQQAAMDIAVVKAMLSPFSWWEPAKQIKTVADTGSPAERRMNIDTDSLATYTNPNTKKEIYVGNWKIKYTEAYVFPVYPNTEYQLTIAEKAKYGQNAVRDINNPDRFYNPDTHILTEPATSVLFNYGPAVRKSAAKGDDVALGDFVLEDINDTFIPMNIILSSRTSKSRRLLESCSYIGDLCRKPEDGENYPRALHIKSSKYNKHRWVDKYGNAQQGVCDTDYRIVFDMDNSQNFETIMEGWQQLPYIPQLVVVETGEVEHSREGSASAVMFLTDPISNEDRRKVATAFFNAIGRKTNELPFSLNHSFQGKYKSPWHKHGGKLQRDVWVRLVNNDVEAISTPALVAWAEDILSSDSGIVTPRNNIENYIKRNANVVEEGQKFSGVMTIAASAEYRSELLDEYNQLFKNKIHVGERHNILVKEISLTLLQYYVLEGKKAVYDHDTANEVARYYWLTQQHRIENSDREISYKTVKQIAEGAVRRDRECIGVVEISDRCFKWALFRQFRMIEQSSKIDYLDIARQWDIDHGTNLVHSNWGTYTRKKLRDAESKWNFPSEFDIFYGNQRSGSDRIGRHRSYNTKKLKSFCYNCLKYIELSDIYASTQSNQQPEINTYRFDPTSDKSKRDEIATFLWNVELCKRQLRRHHSKFGAGNVLLRLKFNKNERRYKSTLSQVIHNNTEFTSMLLHADEDRMTVAMLCAIVVQLYENCLEYMTNHVDRTYQELNNEAFKKAVIQPIYKHFGIDGTIVYELFLMLTQTKLSFVKRRKNAPQLKKSTIVGNGMLDIGIKFRARLLSELEQAEYQQNQLEIAVESIRNDSSNIDPAELQKDLQLAENTAINLANTGINDCKKSEIKQHIKDSFVFIDSRNFRLMTVEDYCKYMNPIETRTIA